MKTFALLGSLIATTGLGLLTACGGGTSGGGTNGGGTTPPTTSYNTLTVNSSSPASGVTITVSPADKNGTASGATSLALSYAAGTTVTLTAPAASGANFFSAWTGCTTATGPICNVTLSSSMTVTAVYTPIAITPVNPTATIGQTLQLTATLNGAVPTAGAITWSVSATSGNAGTISSSGLYTTPYPAPASVTVTATNAANTAQSAQTTITLTAPAAASGPSLAVDLTNRLHAISPNIYGVNGYLLDSTSLATANVSVVRWGGDGVSRYNYQTNTTNSASDWFFENQTGASGIWPDATFNGLVTAGATNNVRIVGTVPVLGWVANATATACSYPTASYPNQYKVDSSRNCGDGEDANQKNITGNDPTVTSQTVTSAWAGNWVADVVTKHGTAASGKGVTIWDLDNEPTWWDAVHRDVHPAPFTYDEVTTNGIATAKAIKTADPTAAVSGPVLDWWGSYFYSKKDIEQGWSTGPCYQIWSNPTDRTAHGGKPLIEYYLAQFNAASQTAGVRLLDYLDLHTYFAGSVGTTSVGLTTAGDTTAQKVRLDSTRVFWDPTYTDPNFQQPNYKTDANYTSGCTVPAQAPELIPMMKGWVASNYPGTKLAIDEYNWGGMESINGAVAEADILGIFGREGLDLATLWPTTNYNQQQPGNLAFALYRNYDGKQSGFGDEAVAATSGGAGNASQGALAIYAATRTSDGALTVVVINKTYGDLTSAITLNGLAKTATTAAVYRLSNASLTALQAQPALSVTPPTGGATAGTMTATFPGQSATLLVIAQ